ncbi:MAG: response regulator [Chitinophagales bacterium]
MIDFKNSDQTPKVMLIDDNAGEVIILKAALKKISIKNIEFKAYKNPVEAVEKLEELVKTPEGRQELPHLILLDLNMPEMNGTEVLIRLKAIEALRVIPIIIITTSAIVEELEKCYKLNANSVLQKPMDFEDYVKTLDVITQFWFHHAARIEVH